LPERVRVAVIDSGVNPQHPHIGPIAGGISILHGGEIGADYLDLLGHGTAVMAAIQEKVIPGKSAEADYFAVRLFDRALRTSAANLLRALDWCVENRMDVVNLSLGTTNPAHAESFRKVAARAAQVGTLLVAAFDAGGQPCYPGCLPGVVGVKLDWDCPRDQFRYADAVFHASGYPRSAPGVPCERNLSGISFAVANMTGCIVRDGLYPISVLRRLVVRLSSGLL
jgi:subtilisin family serine protease